MWNVIRQPRAGGISYAAQWKGQPPRTVRIGTLTGDPQTLALTERVRAADPTGQLDDAAIIALCGGTGSASQPTARATGVTAKVGADMTLRKYVGDVWAPVRMKRAGTWKRENGWWERSILPVVGDTKLCDLTAYGWSAFLDTLTTCGGRSKGIVQNAYRVALKHAVDVLEWLPNLHRFRPIEGATKKRLAEVEVLRLLDAADDPMHRALFAVAVGQVSVRAGDARQGGRSAGRLDLEGRRHRRRAA